MKVSASLHACANISSAMPQQHVQRHLSSRIRTRLRDPVWLGSAWVILTFLGLCMLHIFYADVIRQYRPVLQIPFHALHTSRSFFDDLSLMISTLPATAFVRRAQTLSCQIYTRACRVDPAYLVQIASVHQVPKEPVGAASPSQQSSLLQPQIFTGKGGHGLHGQASSPPNLGPLMVPQILAAAPEAFISCGQHALAQHASALAASASAPKSPPVPLFV